MKSPAFPVHHAGTVLVHAGRNPERYHGFVNPPVFHASTVLFPDATTMAHRAQPYTYATRGTPTTDALCDALNRLEGAAGTVLVPTGLAAVTLPLLIFASVGDHVLIVDSVYGPTRQFADGMLKRLGVEVEYYHPLEGAEIAKRFKPNTRVVFLESPGSNTFEMQDVPAIAAAARKIGAISMIDNTWATPLCFRPLEHGVDLSIQAATKYIAGHSDLLMGTVSANEAHAAALKAGAVLLGLAVGGDDANLALRGLRTMLVRVERHAASALQIARWLETRPEIARVLHPALESHPGHAIWKRDFDGATGLFSFVLRDADTDATRCFLDALRLFGLGFSWGGFESLAVHVQLADRVLATDPGEGAIIRLQIGLEDPQDLISDLTAALAAVGP